MQQIDNIGVIERKVLGALLVFSNEDKIAHCSTNDIADIIGYKTSGGALSFALKILERDNYIVKIERATYKILI